MTTSRRAFLRATAVTAGVFASGPWRALQALADTGGPSDLLLAPDNGGLGQLIVAGPELGLPAGFRYVRFGGSGTPMTNGKPTPANHDGMGAFKGPNGSVLLVRNHETGGEGAPFGGRPYDPRAGGGTTTMIFDPQDARLVATFPSLTGTAVNCSGGKTPWGTWLSCEETTAGPGGDYSEPHGYCFEVDPKASSPVDPRPLKAMGRFKREAVCVDPGSGIVYQTEDETAAGLYRFTPRQKGNLTSGGRLQMLGIAGHHDYHLGWSHPRGTSLPVDWVDLPDPNPADMGHDRRAVYWQGKSRGGATFRRLEGCAWQNGRVVLVSTNGGKAEVGQVWEYHPGRNRIELLFESPSEDVLRMPDNVTGAPWGGVVLCEDASGPDTLRGLTRQGQIFTIARNRFSDGEFAGPTFCPHGRWLFVNVQRPGVTFAITGPWEKIL